MLEKKIYVVTRIVSAMIIGVLAVGWLSITINAQKPDKKDKQKQEKQQKGQQTTQRTQQQPAPQQQRAQTVQRAQRQRPAQQQQQQTAQRAQRQRPAQQQQQQQTAQRQLQTDQRLSQQRQQLLNQQQQRLVLYRQQAQGQDSLWIQRSALLHQQRRAAQYRFQQGYIERRRQQILDQQVSSYDYNNDPNFYSAANYRYSRGGRYYQTNQYGANLLRQAVNYGYEEGFQAGRADQEDHWRSANYQNSYAYQDANYGYTGYYVAQTEYSYYFREGFRRGYDDGYNSRSQYGIATNGSYSILSTILSQILNLSSF
jgi:flagellar biosynthesis GTPase FlhF